MLSKKTIIVLAAFLLVICGALFASRYLHLPGIPEQVSPSGSPENGEMSALPNEANSEESAQAHRLLSQAKELAKQKSFDNALKFLSELKERYGDLQADDEMDSFGTIARQESNFIECMKTRPEDFGRESPEDIRSSVLSAIRAKNRKDLLSYASCRFVVGVCFSDHFDYPNPQKDLTDEFFTHLEAKFSKHSGAAGPGDESGFGSEDLTVPLNDQDEERLQFGERDGKWRWIGYCTNMETYETQKWVRE